MQRALHFIRRRSARAQVGLPVGGRRFLAALAATGLLIAAGLAAQDERSSRDLDSSPLAFAHSLIRDGDYARAAATLQAAYRAHPSESLRMEFARSLISNGDYDRALELLQKAFLDPSLEKARYYLRAEALLRARRFDQAEALLSVSSAADRDGRALLLSARAAYGAGRFDTARSLIGEALRAGGESIGDAWMFRMRLALDSGDFDVAKSAVERAREVGVDRRMLAAAEIESLIREGKSGAASAALARLAENTKRRGANADAQYQYLQALMEASSADYVPAARRLRDLKGWLAAAPHGELLLAMVQNYAGDTAQAEQRFERLLAGTPDNPLVISANIDRLIASGRIEEARIAVRELPTSLPPPAAGYLRMAEARAAGDYDSVVEAAKSVHGLAPPPSPAEIVLGPQSQAATRARESRAKLTALSDAAGALLESDARAAEKTANRYAGEDDPALLNLVGELYLAAGDDAQAKAVFDRVMTKSPGFATALKNGVRVAVRAGDWDGAAALLERAIARADSLAARGLLARVLLVEGEAAGAAKVLAPVESRLSGAPSEALIYASALAEAGQRPVLVDFAERFRRARPADPAIVVILSKAELYDAEAAAAKAALLAAPARPQMIAAYRSAMEKTGKTEEAEAFLAAYMGRRAAAPKGARSKAAGGQTLPEAGDHSTGASELEAARRAYLAAPDDAAAISRFGTALARAGADRESLRVMREACLWSAVGGCRAEKAPRT